MIGPAPSATPRRRRVGLASALAASVVHGGYRFAFSGPYVAQQEPCGAVSVCFWPEGPVPELTPRLVPLDAPELRDVRRWLPEVGE